MYNDKLKPINNLVIKIKLDVRRLGTKEIPPELEKNMRRLHKMVAALTYDELKHGKELRFHLAQTLETENTPVKQYLVGSYYMVKSAIEAYRKELGY